MSSKKKKPNSSLTDSSLSGKTAQIFVNGGSQAVRLPKAFRFANKRVYIQKLGDGVLLTPIKSGNAKNEKIWQGFFAMRDSFEPDEEFMKTRHCNELSQSRDSFE